MTSNHFRAEMDGRLSCVVIRGFSVTITEMDAVPPEELTINFGSGSYGFDATNLPYTKETLYKSKNRVPFYAPFQKGRYK